MSFNVLTGVLKLVGLVAACLLVLFFAFELLDINMDFNIGEIFGKYFSIS